MGIQEDNVNWNTFFHRCLEKDDELVRAYWYQAKNLNNPSIGLDRAQRITECQNTGKSQRK